MSGFRKSFVRYGSSHKVDEAILDKASDDLENPIFLPVVVLPKG